jgi:hypothetical protein
MSETLLGKVSTIPSEEIDKAPLPLSALPLLFGYGNCHSLPPGRVRPCSKSVTVPRTGKVGKGRAFGRQ